MIASKQPRFILPVCAVAVLLLVGDFLLASDWPRFRGPNGSGISPDSEPAPVTWSATENLKWTIDLPGPGSSCPIVVGDKVFVTCWSGYGLDRNEPGDQVNLKRHLVCVNRSTGEVIWDQAVDPYLPEEEYGGMFAEHGYTSHTPVSDGEKVFAFFGKTGVVAVDMQGKKLWQVAVGTESGVHGWGSASSPVLVNNLVIVPATAESHSLVALDKETGKVVWNQEAQGFEATWGTPVLVDAPDNKQEIILGVPGELWAFKPEDGKLKWYSQGSGGNAYCSSVIVEDGIVYALGGREGGTVAVKAGGSGDVSETHLLWSGSQRGGIGTPLIHEGLIYWIGRDIANCISATDGEEVYQQRLEAPATDDQPASDPPAEEPGGGRRRGGFMNQSYSSAVAADGKLYFVTRRGLCYVVKLGAEFEQLAVNDFGDPGADFSATPAVSNGELFVRSSKKLYCVAQQK